MGINMCKLLLANFKRMWKDKIFWIGTIFMLISGIAMVITRYVDMKKTGMINHLDNGFFAYILFIAIISSILCSLYIGTEHSDGTMRNKLIIGHTRISIYFANLFACVIAEVIMCLVFIAATLCVGIPLLGFFEENIIVIIGMLLCSLVLIMALTSIFTLVSMLVNVKAITAIICILIAFFLIFTGIQISDKLNQPESHTIARIPNGSDELVKEEVENPNYLRGIERKIYEFLYDFTPGGQIIQLSGMTAVNLRQMALYSTIIVVITTGLGLYIFRKKDLK